VAKKIVKERVTSRPLSINIQDAILKKALGYEVSEVIEEYAMVDNELILVKKKVNTKSYPPDLDAIEMALQEGRDNGKYCDMTDEALIDEHDRLMALFKKMKKE